MGRVFISYAHMDDTKAQKVKQRLDELGFDCWIDRSAPATRDDISSTIDSEIDKVDSVLVLWSEAARISVWVRGEALSGLSRNKYFGLLLDAMVPPVPFNALVAPDLTDWTGLHDHLGWNALVRGLATMSSGAVEIIAKLDSQQKKERDEADRLRNAQAPLPLEGTEEPLDQGPVYTDVEAIVSAAKNLLGGAAKFDLAAAMTQATLDHEMLRVATYVVSASTDVPRPSGAMFEILPTINQALGKAMEGDLIVVVPGVYEECLVIPKDVRLVGLGRAAQKPLIRANANANRSAVAFTGSARLENFSIETRHVYHAIHCGAGQPVILRCDIRRFSDKSTHQAFYVAGRANPIVIASSLAATGCDALYFVNSCGGQFLGCHVVAVRGNGMSCRGRPTFSGCTIEAVGGHAIEVAANGSPDFHDCAISGRGQSVVRVAANSYPRIKESRVNSIRQLAFDFEQNASGRVEANIISFERGADAGTGAEKAKSGFFGLLKSKENAMVRAAVNRDEFVRLHDGARTLFIANTTPDGESLDNPSPSRAH